MSERATTTTPDPELNYPLEKPVGGLGGENARGEPAGCPTGLADQAPVIQKQAAPKTSVPPSPGEGVTEQQVEESGLDDPKR